MNLLRDKSVQLTLWLMVGVGAAVGFLFPFFIEAIFHLPSEQIFTLSFLFICVASGVAVGLISFYVVYTTIFKKIEVLKNKLSNMYYVIFNHIEGKSTEFLQNEDNHTCNLYRIHEESDVIGLGKEYNLFINMIRSLLWQYDKTDLLHHNISKVSLYNDLNKTFGNFLIENFDCLGFELYSLNNKLQTVEKRYSFFSNNRKKHHGDKNI